MLIHDGIYDWPGFGGRLKLASGRCRLRIFDLSKAPPGAKTAHLRPTIVLVSDVPGSRMSVRSCAGHVATCISREYALSPGRMMYVEHYPQSIYGRQGERIIPEKFDAVEFEWTEGGAIRPKWRTLQGPILEAIRAAVQLFSPPRAGGAGGGGNPPLPPL
jgi:hypothetical protein